MARDAREALFALARASADASRQLESGGLSFAEIRLLVALREAEEAGATRVTDLARELALTPSGVTRALGPLERRKIVDRIRDERDARASQTRLTAAGRELLDEALDVVDHRAARLLRRLSVGQTKQLQRLLEEIRG